MSAVIEIMYKDNCPFRLYEIPNTYIHMLEMVYDHTTVIIAYNYMEKSHFMLDRHDITTHGTRCVKI